MSDRPRFKWTKFEPPDYINRLLPEALESAHHLDGWAVAGPSLPLFFFRTEKTEPVQPSFLAWDDVGIFGATLTSTAYCGIGQNLEISRVCVNPSTPVFEQIQHGRFIAIFVNSSSILATGEVDMSWMTGRMSFSQAWSRVKGHVPVLSDELAHYWECLDLLLNSDAKWPQSCLTKSDHLSLGWLRYYKAVVKNLNDAINQAKTGPQLTMPGEDITREVAIFMNSINNHDLSVELLRHTLLKIRVLDNEAIIRLLKSEGLYHDYCHSVSEHAHCVLLSLALQTLFLSSKTTREGHRVVCVDETKTFKMSYLDLEPSEFPHFCHPQDYWFRLPSPILPSLAANKFINGREVHQDLRFNSPLWDSFPVVEDPDSAFETAEALIDEALSSKKWSIPNGAIVRLRVGPFGFFEVWESEAQVSFLARSDRGEFSFFVLNLREHSLWFDALLGAPEEKGAKIEAALKLLLSAIVRDFYVAETRESVFTVAQEKRLPIQRLNREGPITVYLPRVKSVRSPDISMCAKELGQQERRAHSVRAHLRKSSFASEHQLILASRYGLEIPEGHTFVRPHHRGQKARDIIYVSRSALQSLYQATPQKSNKAVTSTDWFRFETDVQELMTRLGFVVDHTGASKNGDHGVDVFARKGRDLEEVCWVIQCKCYSSKQKVGPGVIQSLMGALQDYPRGTRGMVVTTSSFTSGARRVATESNIRLMDGEEFRRLFHN